MNKKFKSFLSEITKSLDIKEGTGYSDEEVKSGKQRSGRPYPEAKFPGWKVGKNMQTQKVKNGKKIGAARTIAAVSEDIKEDIQTPERTAQMTKALVRLGGEHNGTSPAIKKQQKKQAATYSRDRMERQSSNLYDKGGKIIKKKATVKEDIEQVDELSKPLLKRYVAKRGSQLSSMMYGSGKNYNSLTGKKQANAVKGIKKAMGVKEDVEQVDEAGQAKLYRMRYSHGRAWRRGDKKKQDAMGVATYDKQKKEDAKDLNRTGSAFGMRVKRLAGNRKAMGYSESTLIGKQKKLDVNKNKRLDAGDFKALRAKRTKPER